MTLTLVYHDFTESKILMSEAQKEDFVQLAKSWFDNGKIRSWRIH
jgi:hypothetical protein